ncbi:Phosphoglycerate mutase family protein [hydrothermal vent metagenome]|uniref:Phosphoglycerate mutase family protein n=1 Tax=hydrothermal vent metagenome TaxID=652676 RepID=A0A3B0SHU3_9ZZZZ
MAEIILVRHGQANYTANSEADYDRLSELGQQQARWLGAHLTTTNPHFDRVITGTLIRQINTARAMGYDRAEQDTALNELPYFALAQALEAQFNVPAPQDARDFAAHLPAVIDHWAQGKLTGVPETFEAFTARVTNLIDTLCSHSGRILLVTSGGVIGMIMRHALGLHNGATSKMMLQIINSSLHRLEYVHDQLMVAGFNATPHLDSPDRAYAKTHV